MKYWMLTLTCISLFPFAHLQAAEPVSASADVIFKEAVVFCNQASRLSRTDPTEARQQIQQYAKSLQRARALDPELLDTNSFAGREHKRCTLIEDNIARAEAMPLVEDSLAQCGEARAALDGADLTAAADAFARFQTLRDQALEVTPTVLRVGSVAVRMRVCDRLVEKISLAKAERQLELQTSQRALGYFNKAMASCEAGEAILNKQTPSDATVASLEAVLNQLNNHNGQGEALVSSLDSGADAGNLQRLQHRISACRSDVVAAVGAIKQHLQEQALAQRSVLQGQEVSQISDNSL
ncbi:hypothetical protein [Ketobacter sp.]|uniref:hypothetical protein n=1 Tax=Ketobacter sp. TaxID=2083498 RepID=UPI0025BD2631|nr:hypothetical protein [Ketobacter sp.]